MLNGVELNAAPLNTGEKFNWLVWAQLNAGLNAPAVTRTRTLSASIAPSATLNTPAVARNRGLSASLAPLPFIVCDTDIANNPNKTYLATDPRTSLAASISASIGIRANEAATPTPTATATAVLSRMRNLGYPAGSIVVGQSATIAAPRLTKISSIAAAALPSLNAAQPNVIRNRGLAATPSPGASITAALSRNPRVQAAATAPSAGITVALTINKMLSAAASGEMTALNGSEPLQKKKFLAASLTGTLSVNTQLVMNPYTRAPARRTVILPRTVRKVIVLDPEREMYA